MWTYGSGETLEIARNAASTHLLAEIKQILQGENRTSQKTLSHRTSSVHYHFLFYLIIFLFSGMERNVVKDEKDVIRGFKEDFDICGNN